MQLQENARQLAKKYKQPILITLLYLSLYMSIRDLMIEMLPLFAIAIFLLTISIRHTEVKLGLDIVEENKFYPPQQAMCGIKRVKELFSTYFWSELIIFILLTACLSGLVLGMYPYLQSLYQVLEAELSYGIDTTLIQIFNLLIMVANVGIVISEIVYNTFFFSAPYILETKKIKGLKVIKEAYRLQKGHFFEIAKTFSSYYAFMLIFACLSFLASFYLSETLLYSAVDIMISVIAILVYESQYVVCKALLYKKLSQEEDYDFSNF